MMMAKQVLKCLAEGWELAMLSREDQQIDCRKLKSYHIVECNAATIMG